MEASFSSSNLMIRILLACGIFSALIVFATDVIAGLLTPGYHFWSQSASLLSAVNSKTRKYVLPLLIFSSALLLAFSIGVWMVVGQNWLLRVTACLLAGNALLSGMAFSIFPFRPNEPLNTPANKRNIIVMGISVLLFFVAIGFGVAGNKNWFRYFSIGLILLYFIVDIFATRGMKASIGGNPGPLVGVQERTMIYGNMIWLTMQALILLKID